VLDRTALSWFLSELRGGTAPEVSPNGKSICYEVVRWMGGKVLSPQERLRALFSAPPGFRPIPTSVIPSGGICVIDAEATTAGLVLTDTGCDPVWSPDGTKIAYTFTDGLHVVNADGSNHIKLYPEVGILVHEQPVWSPDGQKIAWASVSFGTPRHVTLYVLNADGSNTTMLSGDGYNPIWSRDSKRIIFEPFSGPEELWVANDDGTNKMRLAQDLDWGHPVALSPDGERVLYISGGKLYSLNTDGTDIADLINEHVVAFAVSPDGMRIAYIRTGFLEGGEDGLWWESDGLWVMNTDGTGNVKIADFSESTRGLESDIVRGGEFVWSPDSRYVAYTQSKYASRVKSQTSSTITTTASNDFCLYVWDVDTGISTPLVSGANTGGLRPSCPITHIRWLP
jgi:Tol biopolymer transport system component